MYSGKVLTGLAFLCAVIIGVSLYTSSVFSKDAKTLEERINVIEENISKSDWTSAEKNLKAIEEEWGKMEKAWTVFLDHEEIDNIDTSLVRISKYIETKNTSMAMSEIAVLRQFVKHIPENESLSLKNIF